MLSLLNDATFSFFVLGSAVAGTAGIVGAFAFMRRMTLAADPISHIALPGIAFALLYGINPLIGASITLIGGALLIWILEHRAKTNIDAIIGVVFSATLALGAIFTPKEELEEALFGSSLIPTTFELWGGLAACLAVTMVMLMLRHRIAITLISPEIAKVSNIRITLINLIFLLAFVSAIILGLRFIGALLMGSLIIIPATIARNITKSFYPFLALSSASAIFSMIGGYAIAHALHWELGPSVITVASLLFLGTLAVKK